MADPATARVFHLKVPTHLLTDLTDQTDRSDESHLLTTDPFELRSRSLGHVVSRDSSSVNHNNKDRDLSSDKVIKILKDPEKDKPVCHFPPVNPKGGDVYLFSPKDKDAK
uniref:Uncharacterized protein n=1 Tax=Amphimedon queenslandica TaxID=400682 RepID=A0A1X7SSI2_AMPQE